MLTKKQKYQQNRSHLRKLLKHFREGGEGRTPVSGKFGYTYNGKYSYHQIVNTLNGTVIATVKQRRDKLVIRYRPNSWYADLLSDHTKFDSQGHAKPIVVPSGNLGRHRGEAVSTVTDAVRVRESQEREDMTMRQEAVAEMSDGIADNTGVSASSNLTHEDIRRASEMLRSEPAIFSSTPSRAHIELVNRMLEPTFAQYAEPNQYFVADTFTSEPDALWTVTPTEEQPPARLYEFDTTTIGSDFGPNVGS